MILQRRCRIHKCDTGTVWECGRARTSEKKAKWVVAFVCVEMIGGVPGSTNKRTDFLHSERGDIFEFTIEKCVNIRQKSGSDKGAAQPIRDTFMNPDLSAPKSCHSERIKVDC